MGAPRATYSSDSLLMLPLTTRRLAALAGTKSQWFHASAAARGATTPLVLLAKHSVDPLKLQGYLEWAEKVDKAVEATEPGMLHHALDRDPDAEDSFTWTEVYRNDDALVAHLTNEPVLNALSTAPEYLVGGFEIEIYGDVGDKAKAAVDSLGLAVKHHANTGVGYSREL